MTNREEIERRRTFAIISHPDAGKTTLTEKLRLYGGAINQAGSVKGKQSAKHAVSDWMDIEKQRGISVTSSAVSYTHLDGYKRQLLNSSICFINPVAHFSFRYKMQTKRRLSFRSCSCAEGSYGAVSYTHLDVYKRQVLNPAIKPVFDLSIGLCVARLHIFAHFLHTRIAG